MYGFNVVLMIGKWNWWGPALESLNPPNEEGVRMRWGLKLKGDFDSLFMVL